MTLIEAIARMEGYGVPGAIPTRDNNPGDIVAGRFAASEGATGVDARNQRFATFATPEDGFKALRDLLNSPAYRGLTVEQAINKYAPPCENATTNYVALVCHWTGLTPDTVLTESNIG
jgi:hypothetical protein